MTNKPMLSVQRELIQRIADHCKFWIDHPYLEAIADVEVKLRALLDKPSVEPEPYGWVQTAGQCINQITQEWDVVEGWTEKGYLWKALYTEQQAAQHQSEPVACTHEWVDDGKFLLVCTACGAQEDYTQALQLAFELGGTDDGSYDLEAEEICEVIRRHAEQSALVASVSVLLRAIHEIEGFPGVTGDQLRELAARLNGIKPKQ